MPFILTACGVVSVFLAVFNLFEGHFWWFVFNVVTAAMAVWALKGVDK